MAQVLTFQAAQLTGTTVVADTIAWQHSGGNTFVYINASNGSDTTTGTDMLIELLRNSALTSSNFLHN